MKIIAGFFRFILTIILTVLIVALQLATMTVASIQKAVSPEILSEIIKSGFGVLASYSENLSKPAADVICSNEMLTGEYELPSESADISELFSDFTFKYNEETGILNFSGVELDLKNTGILDVDFSKANFDQDTILKILTDSSFVDVASDYTAEIVSGLLTGSKTNPSVTSEQITEAADTLIGAINRNTDLEIPEETAQKLIDEIKNKSEPLALAFNNNLPSAGEIESKYLSSESEFGNTFTSIKKFASPLFKKWVVYVLIGITAFFALILVVIHHRSRFGWLWLSLISLFLGGIFVLIRSVTSGGMLTSVITKRVEFPFDESVLGIFTGIGKAFGSVGKTVLYISLAFFVIYIFALIFRRKNKNTTTAEN